MQRHNLKRQHENKKSKTIGRGGTRGKTSGRGTKGQNARAGHKKRPEIRDFIKRIPKLRGRGKNINTSIETKPTVINLLKINLVFKEGESVSPGTLLSKCLVTLEKGRMPKIKILGNGALDKKLFFKEIKVSEEVRKAVEKAQGSVK